jgi:O-antigen ligase/polysaccharide polymerase Wzy-like membrane protein
VPPRSRLEAVLGAVAETPAVLLTALGLVAVLVLSASNEGYRATEWYAAALFALGLLVVGVLAIPRARLPARPVRVAAAAMAGYTAWSYLSIAWAHQKGDAWDGANRTAMYAILFALFALWPIRGRAVALVVGGFSLVVAVIGLTQLLGAAGAADPSGYFIDGRFASPVGYANADAALWSLAFFPCVVLASRREAAPVLRALLVTAAVLLGGLALMGQSRGWLFALPVVILVFLVVTPRRVRTSLTLLLAAAGVALTIPAVLDVYDKSGAALARAMDSASRAILIAAVVAGAVAGLAALPDRRRRLSRAGGRRLGAALVAAALFAGCAGTVVYVAERGSPFTDVAHAWSQFKTKHTPHGGSNRLGRLGSNRYDFWRVAWDRFANAPLAGIGADNYQEAYLLHGKSGERPLYPHSLELRTLSQTGLVGALLLIAALAAALVAAGRATRRRAGWGAAAAAGGVGAFVYWLVHGSVDWLWEFPALGGAAFAFLGLAAGLAPRRPAPPRQFFRPLGASPLPAVAAVAGGLVLGLSFAGPWLAELEVSQAASSWPAHPGLAFRKLNTASDLNPLSTRPKVIAGSIALRLGDLRLAERYFREALRRDARDAYSYLELGAIEVDTGRRADGIRLLGRAAALQPRDDVTAAALRRARRGGRIDITRMNEELRRRTIRLGR